jgi:hypothetical protein
MSRIDAGNFVDLPLLAGHVVLWSWYCRMDAVLQDKPSPARTRTIIKLWEAVMTASMRFRLTPSFTVFVLAEHRWRMFRILHPGAPFYMTGLPFYMSGAPLYMSGIPFYMSGAPFYMSGAPFYMSGALFYRSSVPFYV